MSWPGRRGVLSAAHGLAPHPDAEFGALRGGRLQRERAPVAADENRSTPDYAHLTFRGGIRGSQYASHAFQNKGTGLYGMFCSMSRKGTCWDNAPSESWFNRFKHERVFGEYVATRAAMTTMAFEYIDVFYNPK
jgi:hypothetical protein